MNYRLMPDKLDEIAHYDGSITANRTNGTIAARCDKEAMNILALNLANDIAGGTKSVEQARADYTRLAAAYKRGERPPYAEKLNFGNDRSAPDPDKGVNAELIGMDGKGDKQQKETGR
jgi:hypothetical protein